MLRMHLLLRLCASARVCAANARRELLQTRSPDRHMGLFTCEQQRLWRQKLRGNRTIVPFMAFVCERWGETGNEIMLRAPALCARSLSQSGTRPGAEYESLISRPHRAYGNEEGLIRCKLECVATPDNVILATLLHRRDFSLNLCKMQQKA